MPKLMRHNRKAEHSKCSDILPASLCYYYSIAPTWTHLGLTKTKTTVCMLNQPTNRQEIANFIKYKSQQACRNDQLIYAITLLKTAWTEK